MKLINEISKIDRFDAAWVQVEKREGKSLKQLKSIATVRSVGASTRIEGSKMTDAEVEVFIERVKISTLEERDEQEVAGYFDALDTITESYKDIEISEANLKNLHKILMRYCEKDEWHRGEYKQMSNAVEASYADGTKRIVFKTTEPGLPTEEAMRQLLDWFHSDKETLPIVKSALFVYEFLSIHPFQDGNGRLSRLLGTLLLLRQGYSWIQYVSFEHEIENRKAEYYKVLMETQKQRPGEPVDLWLIFFLECLLNIQNQLMSKLDTDINSRGTGAMSHLAPREKNILFFIENHPGSKSGEIAEKLNIPLSTVKKMLTTLVNNKMILKYGTGAGTNYIAEPRSQLRTDMMFKLTNTARKKEFLLMSQNSFIELKKIILTPLFPWVRPEEWVTKLVQNRLDFRITGHTSNGLFSNLFTMLAYTSPYHFQPVFILNNPINIPLNVSEIPSTRGQYPIRIEIELLSAVPDIEFEVMFIYDEG